MREKKTAKVQVRALAKTANEKIVCVWRFFVCVQKKYIEKLEKSKKIKQNKRLYTANQSNPFCVFFRSILRRIAKSICNILKFLFVFLCFSTFFWQKENIVLLKVLLHHPYLLASVLCFVILLFFFAPLVSCVFLP